MFGNVAECHGEEYDEDADAVGRAMGKGKEGEGKEKARVGETLQERDSSPGIPTGARISDTEQRLARRSRIG